MYGRIFESMFKGSMVGSGALVFAVWAYVIANMRKDKVVGAQVQIDSYFLALVLGENPEDVEKAISKLCQPDPRSTCKEQEGRRLVSLSGSCYQVVSGAYYLEIRREEDLREYRRLAKRRERKRDHGHGLPLKGEHLAMEASNQHDADKINEMTQPERLDRRD